MKTAVVTFITDEKEFLYPPVFDFAGVDFLCFTELKNVKSQFWEIRSLNGLSIEDIRSATEEYLPQYDRVVFAEAGDVITMDADGDIKVVGKPDISECVDAEYLNEVYSTVTKTRRIAENTPETHLKAHTDEKMSCHLKLTIGMLVGRKSPYFDECFASIQRIMEAIPESELIIVDTGNKDGSVDKARKVAEEGWNITVASFAWIYDFAAARNEAVKRAKGSWFMSIDDDEWFEDISALVEFFEEDKALYKKYDYAMYTIRNYDDAEGKTYRDASVIRLAKNRPDLCYKGRIHENFNFRKKEIAPYTINSYVHHYGYVNNMEARKLKSQRNMALLAIDNEEDPTDSHVIVQIVQEMIFTERFELAYTYVLRGLSVQRAKPDANIKRFVSVLGYILSIVNKRELWNYETQYVRKTQLNYIEMASVVYQYAVAAYQTAIGLFGDEEKSLGADVRKYIDKAIEYSECFEKAYTDYNNASADVQRTISGTICDNLCANEKYLTNMLVIRMLAYEKVRNIKEVFATIKKISPEKLNICSMEYYTLLVQHDIATLEFYHDNETVPSIWMLFIQALLQKPALCAELLKSITTPALDRLVTEASPYVNPVERSSYDQAFEELVVLRLICEYMQAQDYNMALNAVKIALQSSEQARAVALVLFDELKTQIS